MADRLLAEFFGHAGAADGPEGAYHWEDDFDETAEGAELEAEAGGSSGSGGDRRVHDAPPEEVLCRIQSATLWFVSQLCDGQLPNIDLVSRQASNRVLATDSAASEEAGGWDDEAEQEDGSSGAPYVLRLQQQVQRRSLLGRHPESAEAVARLFVLLEIVHELLTTGTQATQRELWYRVKTLEIFRALRDVVEAIQDAVSMLQVPRSALGITASGKGLVAGRLIIHDRRAGTATNCAAAGGTGVLLPGDIARITQHYEYETDAQLVVVIEKDTIFQRLVEQRFFDLIPCILCTGKGMPDLATRAFLSCLSSAFSDLPLVGLADWNPSGVNILSIYKFGSHRMGLESPRYALPSLRWLGAHSTQLREAAAEAFQELTARDRAMAANLSATLRSACPAWTAELQQMLASGSKAEIEALYTVGGAADFPDLLCSCLEHGDCV